MPPQWRNLLFAFSGFSASNVISRRGRRQKPNTEPKAQRKKLSSLLRCHSLHPRIQPALIPVRGVLMQNTLLHALVQDRRGLAVLSRCRGMIALGNRLTQLPQCSTQLALVRAVHRGLSNGLTCALQRRNMICHKLSSLNPYICRGKWDAGQGLPDFDIPVRLPQSLQYLSLRNSSPKVNQLLRFGCLPRRDLSLPLFCRCLFFCLSSRQGSAVVVAVAVAFPGVKGDLLSPLPHYINPKPSQPKARANHPIQRSFPHWSQFIISPLTPIPRRSTLCAYSTHWHL